MISLSKYLACVKQNVQRIHGYESGHDGSDGLCDCIGLGIGAIRLAGGNWPWTHGSNYAARYKTRNIRQVTSPSQLRLGESVFKAKQPGEQGYDMPDKYKSSGDLKDYYHYGVVTRLNPLEITHCTEVPGGIQRDSKLGQWRYAGENSLVDYDEGSEEPMETKYQATVKANNSYPVRMREKPNQNATITADIPQGTVVDVIEETDGTWARISSSYGTGYMMRKFLAKVQGVPDTNTVDKVTVSRSELAAIRDKIDGWLGVG